MEGLRVVKIVKEKKFQAVWGELVLNYEEIGSHWDRLSNIKPLINKYNIGWNKIPIKIDGWKTFEKNIPTFVFNFLYMKETEICPAYASTINSYYGKTNNSLNDPKRKKESWYYLAYKTIRIMKHQGNSSV